MTGPTDPVAEAAARAAQDAETERQRLAAEQRAARQSGVMLQLASGGASLRSGPSSVGQQGRAAEPPASLAPEVEESGRKMDLVGRANRSEEHTSELQSLMRISYAVFCLKKKKK